jgi:maltooligosyltrehalose synthase
MMVFVGRFLSTIAKNEMGLPAGQNAWDNTFHNLEDGGKWVDIVTGKELLASNGMSFGQIFEKIPFSILWKI